MDTYSLNINSRFDDNSGIYLALMDNNSNVKLGGSNVYINVKPPNNLAFISENGNNYNILNNIVTTRFLYGTKYKEVNGCIPSKEELDKCCRDLLIKDFISILKKYCENKK